MAEEATPTETPVTEEKKTNRVFDQSEHDKEIARVQKETESKYSDYATIKAKADEYEKFKAESELAKLSEVEKANKKAEDLEARLIAVEEEKNRLAKTTLKLSVLSDPKYSVLPEPYKKLIDGDTEESVKENAEKSLTEFNEFLKKMGVPQSNSGLPPDISKTVLPKQPINQLVDAIGKRFK